MKKNDNKSQEPEFPVIIETGNPIPPHNRGRKGYLSDLALSLKVGQNAVFTDREKANSFSLALKRYGFFGATRKTIEKDGSATYRVWKTKTEADA